VVSHAGPVRFVPLLEFFQHGWTKVMTSPLTPAIRQW
jgi:hypothetical protein